MKNKKPQKCFIISTWDIKDDGPTLLTVIKCSRDTTEEDIIKVYPEYKHDIIQECYMEDMRGA